MAAQRPLLRIGFHGSGSANGMYYVDLLDVLGDVHLPSIHKSLLKWGREMEKKKDSKKLSGRGRHNILFDPSTLLVLANGLHSAD
jgi:hypothetical protein